MEKDELASIDDLLGGEIDEEKEVETEVKSEEHFVTTEQEADMCDDDQGFENDFNEPHLPLAISNPKDQSENESKGMGGVFRSDMLEDVLEKDSDLVGSVPVPKSLAWKGFTESSTEHMEKISEQLERNDEGISAGLGQKKKTELKMRMKGRMMGGSSTIEDISSSRAKTLAEKRTKLREDILKYGVAAIEKLYPRQGGSSSVKRTGGSSSRRIGSSKSFKLKPAPHDTSSAEIDARKILRPYSHDKYIKHPDDNPVVYIQRRHGLVPLSTLSKQSRTLVPGSVQLLRRRNHTLGRPGHFVRDGGRLVGVGGTRSKSEARVRIHTLPTFERRRPGVMTLFRVDTEFAKFAAGAVKIEPCAKVDIRQLKKNEVQSRAHIDKELKEKPLLDKMMFKMKQSEKAKDDIVSQDYFTSCMESYKSKRKMKETLKNEQDIEQSYDEFKSFNIGLKDKDYVKFESSSAETSHENVLKDSAQEEKNKFEVKEEVKREEGKVYTNNNWSSTPKNVVPKELNLDECPPLTGYKEGSIRNLVPKPIKINFDGYTGYDVCDVEDCVICQDSGSKLDDSRSSIPTELGTPGKSGSQTPSGSKQKPQRIAKDLQRVKRALKTLGVNIIEFDEGDNLKDCLKDYCKLGCICDSLRTKQLPPSHCGKAECMVACCCSKEALKYSSCGSRRVNISAAVGARIMEDTQRGMAAEERKFSNTVVVTADKDTVMLGGRGTRRERKIPERYKNSNTLMLDTSGKDYCVQKEASEESEDEEAMEDKHEDELERLRRSADLIPCSVIVPLVNLPSTTNIWCMYHAQYSCPCSKFRNPLDFAPDIESGELSIGDSDGIKKRKVSQDSLNNDSKQKSRMIGPKSLTKKIKVNDDPLLGIEDIDPDYQEPVASSVRHPLSAPAAQRLKMTQSARTKPVSTKQSFKTKLVVSRKLFKKKARNSKIPDLVKIVGDSDEDEEKDNNLKVSHELNLDITNLSMSTVQYVRWDIVKSKFQSKDIDLYFWVRPGKGRNILFLTKCGERPYVASAINLRNIQGSTGNLPSLVSDSVEEVRERDKGRYCVLECNGTVWTIKRLLAIEGQKDTGFSINTNTAASKENKREDPNKQKDSSVRISLDEQVQKLPVGQSLITVVQGPSQKALMQVKLPPTLTNQYWSLISVGEGQASIQCPDSSLILKCAILQQAATLSTATSTTVRIPIPVADQDPSFGVYAVPGLKSHVFVGPFTAPRTQCVSEDDDDIVCLEDEEVKVLEPNKEKDEEDSENEKKKDEKKDTLLKRRLLGQIPLMVEKNDIEANVDIFETNSQYNQARLLKRKINQDISDLKENDLSDLKPSEYGKLVQRQSARNVEECSLIDIQFKVVEEDRKYSGHLESSGKVVLLHPNHEDHEVICSNVENAKLWLEEHFAAEMVEKEDYEDEEVLFDDPEPLPSEPPKVKTPPPILKRIKTPLLPSGRSNKKIALFVQMKPQRDEAQLFYELGHTAFENFFNKNTSRAKILEKAQKEIHILQAEGKEMELSKQNLLKRRTKLFELFTKSLNGLPVAKKKAAVIELKELLRKDKERKEKGTKSAEPVTASTSSNIKGVIRSPSQSKEHTIVTPSSGATPYTDVTGINTMRPDGSVLRPMNAFMLWAKERRSPLLAQGLGISQVGQILSDNWKAMTEEGRSKYYKEAEHLKTLHKLQHPDYKYSPKTSKQTSPESQAPSTQASVSSIPDQEDNSELEIIQVKPAPVNIQPSGQIQVPKPLAHLSGGQSHPGMSPSLDSKKQSLLVPKATRPAPPLIPVHSQSISISNLQPSTSSNKHRQSQFEVLNIPSRPNIKISTTYTPHATQSQVRERRESVEIIQSCVPTQLTAREPVLSIQEVAGQGGSGQSGQIINIGGESFLLPQEPLPDTQQRLVLSQEQAQQLLVSQGQQQQLYIEPHQQQMLMEQQQPQHMLIETQQQQQQLFLEPGQQHIFLDEHGRQVLLSPDQQLQLVQQLGEGHQLVELGEDQGGELVQLEGESGERVMLTIPSDHNQLLFQAQEEGMDL